MLNSEDADINKVIQEVIDLDKKAVRIKKNVIERAEEIIDSSKKQIKEIEKVELETAQELAKKNYQNEIDKAKNEQLSIIAVMEQEISKIRSRYDEKKEEKAAEVLEKLFRM